MTASPGAALWILRCESEEATASPELRYLASTNREQARQAFGTVEEIVWRPGSAVPAIPTAVPVLVFAADNVHLGVRSLRRMRARLEAGAAVVVPEPLTDLDFDGETVRTLRGFERLEERLLGRESRPRPNDPADLPVALLSPAFVARPPAGMTAEAVLSDLRRLAAEAGPDELARAGICYQLTDYYGGVREDILPFIPRGVADVLDVGCGRGLTGALLQERLGCRVTGVELNPAVARNAAEHLHRVLVGDVESLDVGQRFDAVVAIELFEHLVDPEAFLAKMKTLLRPGGRIVMSVPNVGHYTVVEDLLAGRWDYVPMGLLCTTHLRFFTRATLESWIARAGFSSYEIVAQKTGLPERIEKLAEHVETDRESLATLGFYAVLQTARRGTRVRLRR
ncbi:MAG: class I SAM-dependent methyltransferase [Thermoanaerobaculia bacterium]